MSKKHNVAYVKPQEPSFLRKLKEQAGYKEGPTVDTKREDLGPVDEEDLRDTEEEQPTVVVLEPGHLTAKEAAQEKLRLEKEAEETPADLTTRIIFKAPNKSNKTNTGENLDIKKQSKRSSDSATEAKSRKSKKLQNASLLSFDEEDE